MLRRPVSGLLSLGEAPLLAALAASRQRWLRFLSRRGPPGVDVEDLLQDALIRAARTRSPPLAHRRDAWFFRILKNVAHDAWHAAASAPHSLDPEARLSPALHADLDGMREGDRPWTCDCDDTLAAALTPVQRELVQRVHLAGEAVGEVASSLGLSAGAAYVSLHRARKLLRSEAEEKCGVTDAESAKDCSMGPRCSTGE